MALRRTLLVHRRRITSLVTDRTGNHFITASLDGAIKIWDQSSLSLRHSIIACPSNDTSLKSLDVSLDNRILVSNGNNMLKFWSLKDGSLMHSIPGSIENIIFSNISIDGRRWVIYSCTNGNIWSCCYRWDNQAQIPAIFDDPVKIGRSDAYARNEQPPIAQSTNGTFVATGFADGSIQVYSFDTYNAYFVLVGDFLKYHSTRIRFITFRGNGPGFVCGSDDAVTVFDFQSERKFFLTQKIKILYDSIIKRKRPQFFGAVLSFGDTKLAAIIGNQLVFLNLSDGQTDYVEKLSRGRWHSIESCPANRDVLVVGGDDGAIQLHRATNGRLVKDLSFPRIKSAPDATSTANRAIIKTAFSSCGSHLTAVDVQGKLHAFSLIPRALYENDINIPYQYFFHWEVSDVDFDNQFRPMYTNTPTQLLLEKLPPPYIVDINGSPQDARYQKLVPGRALLHQNDDLLPTMTESDNLTGSKIIDDVFFMEENGEGIFSQLRNPQKNYLTESAWRNENRICQQVLIYECQVPQSEWEMLSTAIGIYENDAPDITYDETLLPSDASREHQLYLGNQEGLNDTSVSETQWRPRRCGLRQRPRVTRRYHVQTTPAMMSQEVAEIFSDFDEDRDPDWSNPNMERSRGRGVESSTDEANSPFGMRSRLPLPPRLDGRPRRNASYRVPLSSQLPRNIGRRRRAVEDSELRVDDDEEENDEEGDRDWDQPSADVSIAEEDNTRDNSTDDSQLESHSGNVDNEAADPVEVQSQADEESEEEVEVKEDGNESDEEIEGDQEDVKGQGSDGDEDPVEDDDEQDVDVEEREDEDESEANESEFESESSEEAPESRSDNTRSTRRKKLAQKRRRAEEVEKENRCVEEKRRRVSDEEDGDSAEMSGEVVPVYLPPMWMTDSLPWPNRCAPQKGETMVYHKLGHLEYLSKVKEVRNEDGSPLFDDERKFHGEYVVVDTVYKTLETGDRVCDTYLRDADNDEEDSSFDEETGNLDDYSAVRYEDMDGVLSYLTPVQLFKDAIAVKWSVGDRCRAIIDDSWWYGCIIDINRSAIEAGNYWLCLKVRWTNSEEAEESISPWDIFTLSNDEEPEDVESKDVQKKEIPPMLPPDWWGSDGYCERVRQVVKKVSQMPEAKNFKYPVDYDFYPAYLILVTYPMDLSTIEKRLVHKFYRTYQALLRDCRLIETNAISFNEDGSEIVTQAQFVVSVLCNVLNLPDMDLKKVENIAQSARSVLGENRKVNSTRRSIRRKKSIEVDQLSLRSRSTRNSRSNRGCRERNNRYSTRPVRQRTRIDYANLFSDHSFDDSDSDEDNIPTLRRPRRRGKSRSGIIR